MGAWADVVKGVVTGVTGPVAEFFTRRAEIKAQERQLASQERLKMHELKMAQMDRQIELKKQGLEADANWEMEFARQAASSWKDEYTLIVVSIPLWMCFIPKLAPYVRDGFGALKETPVWYQGLVLTLFLATVGIRYWRRGQYDTPDLTSSLPSLLPSSTTGSPNESGSLGQLTSGPSGGSLAKNSSES